MSFKADDVNYLIYRYFLESGHVHTSFTFEKESQPFNSRFKDCPIPQYAFLKVIEKGLKYTEMEVSIGEDGLERPLPAPLTLIEAAMPDVVQSKRYDLANFCTPFNDALSVEELKKDESEENDVAVDRVITLKGHKDQVFLCIWNPKNSLLASCSADATAIIWDFKKPNPVEAVLFHCYYTGKTIPDNKEITTIDWHPSGKALVTGSYDGIGRVWNIEGYPICVLSQRHRGPIFALKWNKSGTYIVSACYDHTSVIWDGNTGELLQRFSFHKAPVTDVDWSDDTMFASCSVDKRIFICELGLKIPLMTFYGHKSEINSLRWDPLGRLLASCSDDMTVRLWYPKHKKCVHVLQAHSKEVHILRWSSTGRGTRYPDKKTMLASASSDCTVIVWDYMRGECIHYLKGHTEPVTCLCFSPDGLFIVTGSLDKSVIVWSVISGNLIRKYQINSLVSDVSWYDVGDKIAACGDDGTVFVIDLLK